MKIPKTVASEIAQLINNEDSKENLLSIDKIKTSAPPILTKILVDLENQEPDSRNGLLHIPHRRCPLEVSPGQLKRASNILHALLDAFATRNIKCDFSEKRHPYLPIIEISGIKIWFRLREYTTRQVIKDKKSYSIFEQLRLSYYRVGSVALFPTGKLSFEIDSSQTLGLSCRRKWNESKDDPLETQLNSIIKGLYLFSESIRVWREKQKVEDQFLTHQIEIENLREETAKVRESRFNYVEKIASELQRYNRVVELSDTLNIWLSEEVSPTDKEKLKRLNRWTQDYLKNKNPKFMCLDEIGRDED